ncbi:MAG: glycosyltransferase [Deltaproteobacteria bacterium]|nr:glycosyltransferase [Deltaproteobacteria bacterium]
MLFVRDFLADQQVLRASKAPRTPLVSVILPTYARYKNGYLKRAIDSVLSQTFTDFELIVVDDGSRDGSKDFIEQCVARDPRVVHIRHERNSGLPALRVNEGIELARGQYLAFQFDDDSWRPLALEWLTEMARQHSSETVVVGKVHLHSASGELYLPHVPVKRTYLSQENCIANNSVLVPRHLFDRYGMYDCHLAMRRLTDWDLWLRLIAHVPFIILDKVVSDVYAGNPDAIGMTVPMDLALFRYLHAFPRAHLLTPTCWHNYEVDALSIEGVQFQREFARRLYEQHVVPYYLKFRHSFPHLGGFTATLPRPVRNAVFTRFQRDVSDDASFYHYDVVANRYRNYKIHFQAVTQMDKNWVNEAEVLLLVRVVEPQGKQLLKEALAADRPVAYYLDDDLLTAYEYGEQFSYLAPGKPDYENIVALLKGVDAVWVTNEFIADSVRPYNPRIVPHLGCVSPEWLPDCVPRRDPHRPFKIGYVGTGYRIEEFTLLWGALQQIADEFAGRVTFEFWGLNVDSLAPLSAPTKSVPFTDSYFEYLWRLRENQFDILLAPLLDSPRPRLGKSLIKYYETAVAGALGIFSAVPQYAVLPADITCLKAGNTAAEWLEVLRRTLSMPSDQFDQLRAACIQHVRETYTNVAQIDKYEAAWRGTEFHARTRLKRHADGRPRVVYALHSPYMGGGEIQQWRKLGMVRTYGLEPVVVLPAAFEMTPEANHIREVVRTQDIQLEFLSYTCFTSLFSPTTLPPSEELDSIVPFLERVQPALVHTVTVIPSFGQACRKLNIPHVASLYALDEPPTRPDVPPEVVSPTLVLSDSIRYARHWGEILGTEWACGRVLVPEELFRLGFVKALPRREASKVPPFATPIRLVMAGTLQPRKCQAEAIEAIGLLRREGIDCHLHIYGHTHFFPDYRQQCEGLTKKWGLQDSVRFHGFSNEGEKILETADILLSASTQESFPGTISEAMAAGVLVVTTPIGGIPELVIDGVTGILCGGTGVEALTEGIRRAGRLSSEAYCRIVEEARHVARVEFHPNRALNDLLATYLRAVELHSAMPVSDAETLHARAAVADPQGEIIENSGNPPLRYAPFSGTLRYSLTPRLPDWKGVMMYVCTPMREVTVQLAFRILPENGTVIREGEISCTARNEASWVRLEFPPVQHADRHYFILELHFLAPRGAKIGLFETQPLRLSLKHGARWLGLSPVRPNLYSQLIYEQ